MWRVMSAIKKYRVNEIFYSVQTEGRNAGQPAVFVRFAGCNLSCPFCDTNHEPYTEMTREQIEAEVARLDPHNVNIEPSAMVVFTGGEPTLQLDPSDPNGICYGRFRAIETNGMLPAPSWIEWVTISPKTKLTEGQWRRANELKLLHGQFDERYAVELGERAYSFGIPCYMQPMADAEGKFDPAPAIDFCKRNPIWTVSLQWHKLLNIR